MQTTNTNTKPWPMWLPLAIVSTVITATSGCATQNANTTQYLKVVEDTPRTTQSHQEGHSGRTKKQTSTVLASSSNTKKKTATPPRTSTVLAPSNNPKKKTPTPPQKKDVKLEGDAVKLEGDAVKLEGK